MIWRIRRWPFSASVPSGGSQTISICAGSSAADGRHGPSGCRNRRCLPATGGFGLVMLGMDLQLALTAHRRIPRPCAAPACSPRPEARRPDIVQKRRTSRLFAQVRAEAGPCTVGLSSWCKTYVVGPGFTGDAAPWSAERAALRVADHPRQGGRGRTPSDSFRRLAKVGGDLVCSRSWTRWEAPKFPDLSGMVTQGVRVRPSCRNWRSRAPM